MKFTDFHDAELISTEFLKNESMLRLNFILIDGKIKSLIFREMFAFRFNDFVIKNIVSRLLISTEHDFTDNELHFWVRWVNSLADTAPLINDKAITMCAKEIRDKNFGLLVIEPSWGAEGAVIFRKIENIY